MHNLARSDFHSVFPHAKPSATSTSQLIYNQTKTHSISGYTKHGLNQAIGREFGKGVHPKAILNAVKQPLKIIQQAHNKVKFVGKDATVILNDQGKIITTYGAPRGAPIWNRSGIIKPSQSTICVLEK